MNILAVESSCDETAVAIVKDKAALEFDLVVLHIVILGRSTLHIDLSIAEGEAPGRVDQVCKIATTLSGSG